MLFRSEILKEIENSGIAGLLIFGIPKHKDELVSFRTAHWAHPSPIHASTTSVSTGSPPGVTIDTRPTGFRDKSISQAAFAASAAQLPVV